MGLSCVCSHPRLTSYASGLLISFVTLLVLWLSSDGGAYDEATVNLEVSAQLRVVGPDQPLTATVGQDVVLPCHLSPQRDARSLEVRWIRDKFSETVHHYHNGEDLYKEQIEAYAGRTELLRDGLSAGSLDLRIMGLRPSDDGQYICIVKDGDAYDEATVNLEVSATGTDPHLSLGGYEAGGVRVLCRSAGWYPLPQLLWRDARGQHLPSDPQTHSQDQEGLFEIEGAVIVTGSVEGPLSCVVRSSRLQQEWESSLHISAPFFHNAQPWMVALALVLVLLAVSIGLGVYLFRKQAAQSQELERQSGRLQYLTEELVRKNKERKEQVGELEEKDLRLAHQSARLQYLTEELVRKNNELKAKEAELVRKDTELEEQAAELVQKDKRLVELAAELEKKNLRLEHQSARQQELATELEKKDAKLREQAAGQAWRRFLLPQNRVKVTLDPHTAHSLLVLSQDNCSVKRETEQQQVPDTPERFDTCCCVLGREEFREGRHCWLVEVEGEGLKHSGWAVGVARASVKRKGWINMSPKEGIWAVEYCYDNLKSLTSPPTPLSLSPVPTRIWVCLDCTEGQVSFINHDNWVEIFTFTDVFRKGESMRPWFWLGTNAQLCLRDSTL